MIHKDLKNKPLVEVVLEIKWELEQLIKGAGTSQLMRPARDPHYRLLLGRLFDRFREEYPVHEELPTANIPDEMVGHIIQHRFRSAKEDWPLIQVGPGIFTVNETHRYTWSDFQNRTKESVRVLYDAHPSVADLHIQSLVLRYIDAVEFNYHEHDSFIFLKDKLKIGIKLPDSLFQDTCVDSRPQGFLWQATFQCTKPTGNMHIRFASGEKEGNPAIIWETTLESVGCNVPSMPDRFSDWIDNAQEITEDWFFKLIEGELERIFQGE